MRPTAWGAAQLGEPAGPRGLQGGVNSARRRHQAGTSTARPGLVASKSEMKLERPHFTVPTNFLCRSGLRAEKRGKDRKGKSII